jgi:hypothetical protein
LFHVQLLSLDSRTQEAFPQQEDVCFDGLLLLAISTDAQHIHGHRHATAERRFGGLVVVFCFRFFLSHIQAGQKSYLLVVKRPFKETLHYKKEIVIIAVIVFRAISALHSKLVVISTVISREAAICKSRKCKGLRKTRETRKRTEREKKNKHKDEYAPPALVLLLLLPVLETAIPSATSSA